MQLTYKRKQQQIGMKQVSEQVDESDSWAQISQQSQISDVEMDMSAEF